MSNPNQRYCVSSHRWMIVNDYWDMGKRKIKYKCVDCSKEFTQIVDNKEKESENGKLDQ